MSQTNKIEAKTESIEEAKARGVEVTKCPSIPAKKPFESQKNYSQRVKAATKINASFIPEDLIYLLK